MSAMGFIPMDHLVGKVTRIFWSLGPNGRLRGERMGKVW
jgi:signal peptidase I